MHCRLPWNARHLRTRFQVVPKTLTYSGGEPKRGLFFLCTWCWDRTTLSERMTYLSFLIWVVWQRQSTPVPAHECMTIETALRPQLLGGAASKC